MLFKPVGAGSQRLLGQVRRIAGTRRVGHAGTLDPFASGVLPVAVGRATRLVDSLHSYPKEYVAELRLGRSTDTGDVEGRVTRTSPVPPASAVRAVLPTLMGEIMQTPPAYSAVKVRGKRAYELARQGESAVLEPRRVTIHELELLSADGATLRLRVLCSAGTYIRTLAEEIASRAGAAGHLGALTRTRVGPFRLEQALTPRELDRTAALLGLPRVLCPADEVLLSMPSVVLPLAEARQLVNGRSVDIGRGLADGALVRVYDEEGTLIGVAKPGAAGLRLRLLLK